MGRRWIYKTDAAGRPRRFLSHREALIWAGLKIGKAIRGFALFGLLGSIVQAYRDEGSGWAMFALVFAVVWILFWSLGSLALYLYVALSGGVMDREARRRHREDGTPAHTR